MVRMVMFYHRPYEIAPTCAGVVVLLSLAISSCRRARTPEGPHRRTEQAPSLPARLSDAEFWKLVNDFSEPNGYFQSENFVGNELSFQWVIPELKKNIKPGGVYVGVGPDQNFTYIVGVQPKIAFIVDIRRGNLLQLLMYKALIEMSADRAEFTAKLFGRNKPANIKEDASANAVLEAVYNLPASREVYEKNLKAIIDHLTKTHGFALTANELKDLEFIYGSFFSFGPASRTRTATTAAARFTRRTGTCRSPTTTPRRRTRTSAAKRISARSSAWKKRT
jgi:hypothetical protein